ncbi:MAG: DUF5053 domain-containing protein [Prevotellaceae bacterium]|nr:DUF5053 domain-containing protein [Prevotellaceae bacterium]
MSWKRKSKQNPSLSALGRGTKNTMMDMDNELKKIAALMAAHDTDGFRTFLNELFQRCDSEQKKIITHFVEDELMKSTKKIESVVSDAQIRQQLSEVMDVLPLSHIAKAYFNKSRFWLYQRVNGNIVNGKRACFTADEIKTFNFALQDISRKIGSVAICS